MGMDLTARSNEEIYFRANVWSWRPINDLMLDLGCISQEKHQQMSYNDGRGPTAGTCRVIACRIQKFLDENPTLQKHVYESDTRVDSTGRFLPSDSTEGESAYSVTREHLLEFVNFCTACSEAGGFMVW